jgi:predicted nucleic acid-binding protein
MLLHLDTSIVVDAFTGSRQSLPAVRRATATGDVISCSAIVLYEWLRGPRTTAEYALFEAFFSTDALPAFGVREAARAAGLFQRGKRARQRQADLAIAACAIEARARLWTLNRADFRDIPGLTLYDG